MKKLVFLLIIFVAVLGGIAMVGCQKPSIPTEILLVPQKADAIAKVRIDEILNDEDLADLYARYAVTDPNAPQTLRLALDELKDETGIDLRYFNEAVLFADTSTVEAEVPYFGAIVECNVPAKYFIEVLGKLGVMNFETQKYEDYKIRTLDGEVSIVFLNKELMAVGPINVVKDVIDVGLGKSKPMKGKPYELYDALDDPLLKGAFKVPWMISRDIATVIPLDGQRRVDLAPLRDVDMFGFVLDKKGSTISIEVELHFSNRSSAIDGSESIRSFIAGAEYVAPSPETRNLFKRVRVMTYDSQLSIELEATLSEIKDLIGALEKENIL